MIMRTVFIFVLSCASIGAMEKVPLRPLKFGERTPVYYDVNDKCESYSAALSNGGDLVAIKLLSGPRAGQIACSYSMPRSYSRDDEMDIEDAPDRAFLFLKQLYLKQFIKPDGTVGLGADVESVE